MNEKNVDFAVVNRDPSVKQDVVHLYYVVPHLWH